MELRNLITFSKIASFSSYSKAAENLGYAQSTITTQMQLLEEELGVKLIERTGRKIKLTNSGETFLKYANEIIDLINKSKEVIRSESIPQGTLKIGVIESLCTIRLPKILEVYHERYPNVNIELKVGICSELRKMLKMNIVDVIFILDRKIEDEQFISYMSEYEPMAILCSSSNKLSEKNLITLEDIQNEALILTEKGCSYRKDFEEILQKKSIKTNLVLESGSIEAIKGFVKSNIGITLLPKMTVEKEIKNKELVELNVEECDFNMYTQLLYNKKKYITSAMKTFLDMIE